MKRITFALTEKRANSMARLSEGLASVVAIEKPMFKCPELLSGYVTPGPTCDGQIISSSTDVLHSERVILQDLCNI